MLCPHCLGWNGLEIENHSIEKLPITMYLSLDLKSNICRVRMSKLFTPYPPAQEMLGDERIEKECKG